MVNPTPVKEYSNLDIYILMGQFNIAVRGELLIASDNVVKNQNVLMLSQGLEWV